MLTLLLLSSLASAGSSECVECCKSAGLVSCPTRIQTHGPDSHITKEGGVWRITGLWRLECDGGATYKDGATAALAQRPLAGQVLRMATPPSAIDCYAQHCAAPAGACIKAAANTGEFVLVRCSDNQMLSEEEMKTLAPAPAPAPTPTPAPAKTKALDLSLPPPATRCAAGDSLITAAEKQAAAAGLKLKAGELAEAADTYRAALTIDPCSPEGWAGLGHVALLSGDNNTAITALESATGLKAEAADFWFLLGKAHAAAGASTDARDAFDTALSADPNHTEAKTARDALPPSE